MGNRILSKDCDSVAVDQIRDTVVDLRVNVVRTSCKDNSSSSCFLQILKSLLALFLNVLMYGIHFFPGFVSCCFHLSSRDIRENLSEALGHDFLGGQCQEWVHKGNGRIMKLVHVVLNVLCIGGNDRTVVMVDCVREFVALVRNAGVENKFHTISKQPGHMSVGKLGRIALGLTWNGLDSKFINLSGGGRGKNYLIFQLCKEGIPERIVLKHIQYPGNAHLASNRFLRGKRLIGEQTLVFIFVKVRNVILVLLFTDTALAAVSAYKLASSCEFVDGETAAVGTSVAVSHGGCVFQLIDLVNRKHGGLTTLCVVAFFGNQGCTEGTHDSGNVRTDGLTACNTLKASKNTVVVEGSALYNNVPAKLLCIGNLDNLVKSILDNRVGKSGRDICDRSAFLLGLFYLGVHKYGTSGTKVNRMLCKKSGFGEILHGVVQGFGKGFNKGTAARGTCLVQLYAVNGLVADLDALHILSADIYDTVNLRIKESSCIVMGNGLNLALIQQQGSLH